MLDELKSRVDNKIIEENNYILLKKLIEKAETLEEAIAIQQLGTMWKKTGFSYDVRLEKMTDDIYYLKKDEKLSFTQPEAKQTHKLIIGDNYKALINLQQEYQGKIKMIYIDPPYGKDSMGEFAKTNYKNNITRDNLLSMLEPRLRLARQLLSDDGVIFCSIDDKNQAYVKILFDEVFGEGNFVNNFMWLIGKGKKDKNSRTLQQYILCYAKNKELLPNWIDLKTTTGKMANPDNDARGKWFSGSISFSEERSNKNRDTYFTIQSPSGIKWTRQWMVEDKREMDELLKDNKIYFGEAPEYNKVPRLKIFETDLQEIIPDNIFSGVGTTKSAIEEIKKIFGKILFDTPKPTNLIKHLLTIASQKDSIILDFFAGSGTTGQAVLEQNKADGGNRQFILVQLDEEV